MSEQKNKLIIINKLKSYMLKKELSESSLEKILIKENITKQEFYRYFPNKIVSLGIFYFENVDETVINNVKKSIVAEKSTSKKVSILLKEKLKILNSDRIKTIYFIDFLIMRPLLFSKLCYKFSDLVWSEIKDKSTDFNYYSKRFILFTIYKKTLFYWRGNSNLEMISNYIDKQILLVGKFGKLKKSVLDKLSNINAFKILNKFDFMHK